MARLVLGTNINNTGTSSTVVEKPVPMPYSMQFIRDQNGKLLSPNGIMVFDGITSVGDYTLFYKYYNNMSIRDEISLPFTTIEGIYACQYMFGNCTNLTSICFPNLESISGSQGCYYMFYNCTKLESVDLNSLTTINGQSSCQYMFSYCTNLESLSFPVLNTILGSTSCRRMFTNCSKLKSIFFPALTSNSFGTVDNNQFDGLVRSVTGCTIHFPSNLDPESGSTVISSLTGYPNFAGTNTVLAFDLPATE